MSVYEVALSMLQKNLDSELIAHYIALEAKKGNV